jgi:hypothetical protein
LKLNFLKYVILSLVNVTKWNIRTLDNMHIDYYDIWDSNTILFRWFKVDILNWRTSCRTSLHGATPSRWRADACGTAGEGLVSPSCQRGGPAALPHVVRILPRHAGRRGQKG